MLKSELERTTRALQNKNTPEVDNIPEEVPKAMEDYGIELMHAFCSKLWNTEQWCESIFIPRHKKMIAITLEPKERPKAF